jgi:hypothetical protein
MMECILYNAPSTFLCDSQVSPFPTNVQAMGPVLVVELFELTHGAQQVVLVPAQGAFETARQPSPNSTVGHHAVAVSHPVPPTPQPRSTPTTSVTRPDEVFGKHNGIVSAVA